MENKIGKSFSRTTKNIDRHVLEEMKKATIVSNRVVDVISMRSAIQAECLFVKFAILVLGDIINASIPIVD
jgi:hypothetical protein